MILERKGMFGIHLLFWISIFSIMDGPFDNILIKVSTPMEAFPSLREGRDEPIFKDFIFARKDFDQQGREVVMHSSD